jgi:6-phosphogluconolactonase
MEHFYDTREQASLAAADRITQALARRLEAQAAASLVVSGGTTPSRCFEALAGADLDWERVHVLPSDERWVPAGDEASNEKLIRETLLQGKAEDATFWPFYAEGADIAEHCIELGETIHTLPIPFACSLLGMGEDGHFASLFPDADNLDQGLDHEGPDLCLPVTTAASPHPRISLTLTALSRSDEIVLLIFGERKRAVYEEAKSSGSTYPVAHLIRQKRAPVRVIWAP